MHILEGFPGTKRVPKKQISRLQGHVDTFIFSESFSRKINKLNKLNQIKSN